MLLKLIVCPCCGFKFEGDLRKGCTSCGARAVGDPLVAPAVQLPSYMRSFFVGAVGALLLLVFLISTIAALLERKPLAFDFWSLVAAAETASWRLKFVALPTTLIALWGGLRLCAGMRRTPARFVGIGFAHSGLAASMLVAAMCITFIGVTIPERLRQRRLGIEAGIEAQAWTIQHALLEYRSRHNGSYPSSLDNLRELSDPYGFIAAAIDNLDQNSYLPTSRQASTLLSDKKSRSLRGAILRRTAAEIGTEDVPDEGVAFTEYELRLPGEDKIAGTDDDWLVKDGIIIKPSVTAKASNASSDATQP